MKRNVTEAKAEPANFFFRRRREPKTVPINISIPIAARTSERNFRKTQKAGAEGGEGREDEAVDFAACYFIGNFLFFTLN